MKIVAIYFWGFLFSVKTFAQAPYIVVLGTAQDGGYPQAGCNKDCCRAVWEKKLAFQAVSCLALVDPQTNQRWLFDATPDFKEQLQALKTFSKDPSNQLTGIFLTHAHIGHYTGLMDLGREVMGAQQIGVYAMPRMKQFLETNGPWSQLTQIGNIKIQPLQDGQVIQLNERLQVRPFRVPHRDEFSETVGFEIIGLHKRIIFLPDIDKWQKWSTSLKTVIEGMDYAFIDGTFYQDGEINRPMSEVPHPFVTETMALLEELPQNQKAKVQFIHLNHTNPLLRQDSPESEVVRKKGFGIAKMGQRIEI